MQRNLTKFSLLVGLLLLLGSLTACDQRNPEVLRSAHWQLLVTAPKRLTVGQAKFTKQKLVVTTRNGSVESWSYDFNSDDDLVIKTGRYAGTYALANQGQNFQLVPIAGTTQTLEIQRQKK